MSFENDLNYLEKYLSELIGILNNQHLGESLFSIDSNSNKQKLENLTNDLNLKLKHILENVNEKVRLYFLYLFRDYNYSFVNGSFEETIKKYIVEQLFMDLCAIKDSFQAFNQAFQGNLNEVKQFLSKYPKYKNEISFYGTTFLYSSSRNNHFELVKYLIENIRCNINEQNKDYLNETINSSNPTAGSTALHAACFYGHLNIVKYLIENRADYFILNKANETPIENGFNHQQICQFFDNYLICSYSKSTKIFPNKSILDENRIENDSIWEYKSNETNQWISFDQFNSNQLQIHLQNSQINSNLKVSLNKDIYSINLLQFQGQSNSSNERIFIRSRCSSILNFNFYSKWQILFRNRNSNLKNLIECQHWYNVDQQINQQIDDAMHRRQTLTQIQFSFNQKLILFQLNLFSFTFSNVDNQIEGDLRWIPLIISKQNQSQIDNFQSFQIKDIQLKYYRNENINQSSIQVHFGDLTKETTDAIVVSWASEYLLGIIYELAGDQVRNTIQTQIQKRIEDPIISIHADGQIKAKRIYFVLFKIEKDLEIMKKSYENLINLIIKKSNEDQCKSISFPTIGFNSFQLNQQQILIQTIVQSFSQLKSSFSFLVRFIIQHENVQIFDLFNKQIQFYSMNENKSNCQSITFVNSFISIEKGDLTKEKVDVIVVSSSSEELKQIILIEAGNDIYQKYLKENQLNPNWLFLSLPSGNLSCKQIYFIKFNRNQFENNFKQSIQDFLSNVFQNLLANQYESLAFPFISFDQTQFDNQFLIKHFLQEICQQIKFRNLSLLIKFVVLSEENDLFELFRKELNLIDTNKQINDNDDEIISTWEKGDSTTNRFFVSKKSNEFKLIEQEFVQLMKGHCKKLISIERIQNQRWFNQYQEHKKDFYLRLKQNTERRLFHGCPQHVTDSIIQDCFNRSFAGVNGTSYGVGVYFSSDPIYSNQFAKSNSNGERTMFIARVLIGNTTIGNSSMKTRPPGFDTTTDGNHIFVTYHDAQAYAQYLITYK